MSPRFLCVSFLTLIGLRVLLPVVPLWCFFFYNSNSCLCFQVPLWTLQPNTSVEPQGAATPLKWAALWPLWTTAVGWATKWTSARRIAYRAAWKQSYLWTQTAWCSRLTPAGGTHLFFLPNYIVLSVTRKGSCSYKYLMTHSIDFNQTLKVIIGSTFTAD